MAGAVAPLHGGRRARGPSAPRLPRGILAGKVNSTHVTRLQCLHSVCGDLAGLAASCRNDGAGRMGWGGAAAGGQAVLASRLPAGGLAEHRGYCLIFCPNRSAPHTAAGLLMPVEPCWLRIVQQAFHPTLPLDLGSIHQLLGHLNHILPSASIHFTSHSPHPRMPSLAHSNHCHDPSSLSVN